MYDVKDNNPNKTKNYLGKSVTSDGGLVSLTSPQELPHKLAPVFFSGSCGGFDHNLHHRNGYCILNAENRHSQVKIRKRVLTATGRKAKRLTPAGSSLSTMLINIGWRLKILSPRKPIYSHWRIRKTAISVINYFTRTYTIIKVWAK